VSARAGLIAAGSRHHVSHLASDRLIEITLRPYVTGSTLSGLPCSEWPQADLYGSFPGTTGAYEISACKSRSDLNSASPTESLADPPHREDPRAK